MSLNRTEGVKELIEKLKNEDLYKNHLQKDEQILMAFREKAIDFYYGGSRLFKYDKNGFSSHKKFCYNADINNDYINLSKINEIKPITDISKNYKLIKERAKLYAGIEGEGVARLYKYNFLKDDSDVIVLDVEIAFYEDEEKNRIDLLLFNKKTKELKFVEAKHYSNNEIWAKEGNKPEVVKQIKNYEKTINSNVDKIKEEYKKYIEIINEMFNKSLPAPEKVYPKVLLYMFGFDNEQKNKIKKLLKDDGSLNEIEYYFKGNEKGTDLNTLYNSKGN